MDRRRKPVHLCIWHARFLRAVLVKFSKEDLCKISLIQNYFHKQFSLNNVSPCLNRYAVILYHVTKGRISVNIYCIYLHVYIVFTILTYLLYSLIVALVRSYNNHLIFCHLYSIRNMTNFIFTLCWRSNDTCKHASDFNTWISIISKHISTTICNTCMPKGFQCFIFCFLLLLRAVGWGRGQK